MTDSDHYPPAQYREHLEGRGIRDPDGHDHAGVVRDPKVSRYLSILSNHYEPQRADEPGRMPGQARDLEEVRRIRAVEATETGRQAMENGDMPSLKHLTGDRGQQADISGMKAIGKIDQIIESPAPVIVILGEMGAGKTNFAGLIGQRATHLLGIEQVASNISTLRETTEWVDREGNVRDGYVPDFGTMDEWVRQDGDPLDDKPQSAKLFIGDEFSSVADGSGKSGHLARKKMGPLVFKIRKFNGMLVYIAHDESSIHPLLWRVGTIIKKTDKKTAVIADKIKNGELRGVSDPIEGVPPTDWRYNDKDPSPWSWTDTGGEETPEPGEVAYDVAVWTVNRLKKDGYSDRDTAEYVPFGKSWVNDRWNEIQDGEHRSAMDRVEAVTA